MALLVFFAHLARMLPSLVGYVRLGTRPPHSFAFPQPAKKILRQWLKVSLHPQNRIMICYAPENHWSSVRPISTGQLSALLRL
ncbi:MAG: hypothetical protein LBJ91_03175, partial [Clostridiales Family XIII bacterium]|nr:hypothetical protein [Clostridiales Family XIII bacterium]